MTGMLHAEEAESDFKVVVNPEQQYSIWPSTRTNAPGWSDAGFSASKSECLIYISKVWIDMRPLSLRKQMASSEGAQDG